MVETNCIWRFEIERPSLLWQPDLARGSTAKINNLRGTFDSLFSLYSLHTDTGNVSISVRAELDNYSVCRVS